MIPAPQVDGRRVESFFNELRRFAPHYTPDLNLSDPQGAGVALMRVFAQLAETIAVRLDQSPQKNFVAFLDRLGISLLPARAARTPVTFRLAAGLKEAVRVPVGTRVTAPGVEDDIPFETTGELVAIPGILAAVYGVDPSQDFIFRPPLGFLKQEPRTRTELKYEIQSFVPAESNRLQLDHTTELEPGSFVLIGCKEKAVILKKDDGGFVSLEKPVTQDFPAGTVVLPIRDFEVFKGIDVQEHVFYLGHNGIFTVKDETEIKLEIKFNGGQAATLAPLDLLWEFWTKNENAVPEEEEHWEPLTVKTDMTNGLSASGNLVLLKPNDREIKPRQVGGRESRWIRARLKEKLPFNNRPLPEIETIRVGVDSNPTGIFADQGFYNATPLDVQVVRSVGFFPFGAEPRQFDQFYIASEEAFSKREAKVKLNFQLDLQTLGEPSVILVHGEFRSYSIGLRRRLYEFDVRNNRWQILGSPSDNQVSTFSPIAGSVPSAVPNENEIYVFVNTAETREDQTVGNKIWVNSHNAGQATGTWTDLGTPDVADKKLPFGPTAIHTPAGWAHASRVFVVGSDGMLYSRGYPNGASWDLHGSPGAGITLTSPPFVVVAGSKLFIFINGVKSGDPAQFVCWLTLDNNLTAQWKALKPDNTTLSFTARYRPFAQSYIDANGVDQAKVFTFAFLDEADKTSGRLFETDTKDELNDQSSWENLGQPTAAAVSDDKTYAPHGYVEQPAQPKDREGKHIFIRGADDKLYERLDGKLANEPQWKLRSGPNDPNLRDNPNIAVNPQNVPIQIHAFAASGSNSLLRWVSEIRTDAVPATPGRRAVLLGPASTSDRHNDPQYINKDLAIINGTGQGQTRQINAYDGKQALARLATQLTTLPDTTSECEIDGVNVGFARAGANRLFAIHAPVETLNARAVYIRINNSFQNIDSYSRVTGIVSMSPADINPGDNYTLYSELTDLATESLSPDDTGAAPELSWEFWNGRGWLSIRKVVDNTRNLLQEGSVTFHVPKDIERTEVAGQENYWIRARLVGGDYGRETFRVEGNPPNQTVVSDKSTLRPPKVRQLLISYSASPVAPELCLTFNNLNYLDQTAAAETEGSHFPPFERIDEEALTIFFGFDQTFKTGPVRLLLDAVERNFDETRPPEFEWRFRKDRIWKELDAEDGSVALTRQGILMASASDELTRETRFGESLFWIKGSFRKDRNVSEAEYPKPLLRGIFLNTVWATQGETITDEIIGSGTGEENQIHALQHADVLEGEDIRIQEALSAEERERIERQLGKKAVTDRDDIGGTWVRWKEVKALFDCGPEDRCYEIDRASGSLRFGDGKHGTIPFAGIDNIRAFTYRTGGGLLGNVETNKIEALSTAVAGIESVFNPTPAGGGSDKADTNAMLTIGPRQISHRDRAVSVEDFEELASEASRQVAKVRCLRSTNLVRSGTGKPDPCDPRQLHEALTQRGFVSLIIVPDSTDPRPCPSLELRRAVKEYLRERAPGIVATGERIVVRPPDYVIVKITADIFVNTLEKAAAVETEARKKLEQFLHPVHGGPIGKGWEFGRPISKSDVFAVLERIADVDRVEELTFHFRGKTDRDRVVVGPNELIASGDHKLSIKKA